MRLTGRLLSPPRKGRWEVQRTGVGRVPVRPSVRGSSRNFSPMRKKVLETEGKGLSRCKLNRRVTYLGSSSCKKSWTPNPCRLLLSHTSTLTFRPVGVSLFPSQDSSRSSFCLLNGPFNC